MRKLFLGCLLISQPLFASIFCTMNSFTPISCEFSLVHHNRIFIEDGRIKKLIFPEDQLAVRLEETSGQAFVQAKPNFREKVLISVISTDGIVQDIEIVFNNVDSQVVVLRTPTALASIQNERRLAECNSLQSGSLQTRISQILKGEVPVGYRSILTAQSTWSICRGVEAELIGSLEGNAETLFLYQVHNTSIWKKCIYETDFKSACPSWVYLQERKIPRKGRALAIVAVPS